MAVLEEQGFTLVELLTAVAILEHRRMYYMFPKDKLNLLYLHLSSLFLQEFRFRASIIAMQTFDERLIGKHEARG
jgi:hypothetical protein